MSQNILLIEDEALIRRELGHTLRNQGYRVTEAADGVEAVAHLSQEPFDLIISDFMMPNLHGYSLVDLIQFKWPKIPVIVVSGHLSENTARTLLKGVADFLPKPIDLDIMLASVRRFLPS
jgi:DNA-binding NtrC family response regulator